MEEQEVQFVDILLHWRQDESHSEQLLFEE